METRSDGLQTSVPADWNLNIVLLGISSIEERLVGLHCSSLTAHEPAPVQSWDWKLSIYVGLHSGTPRWHLQTKHHLIANTVYPHYVQLLQKLLEEQRREYFQFLVTLTSIVIYFMLYALCFMLYGYVVLFQSTARGSTFQINLLDTNVRQSF